MEDGDEAVKTTVLNAHFMCKDYGGRPADDLAPDIDDPNFRFSLNSFVRRIGNEHEHEEQERRMNENKARNWGKRR